MIYGGGAVILFLGVMALLVVFWVWVIVRAGRWGAARGDQAQAESAPNSERLRHLDLSRLHDDERADRDASGH